MMRKKFSSVYSYLNADIVRQTLIKYQYLIIGNRGVYSHMVNIKVGDWL